MSTDSESSSSQMPRLRRDLSQFLAREMLYDFMMGRLDSDRMRAMQEYLKLNSDLLIELQAMQSAESYLETLSKTRITSTHLSELGGVQSKFTTYLVRFKYKNWPIFVRWTSEAMLISFAIVALALFVPWKKLTQDYAVDFGKKLKNVVAPSEYVGQVKNIETQPVVKIATQTETTTVKKSDGIDNSDGEIEETQGELTKKKLEESAPEKTKVRALKGFVYSMMMSLNETEKLTPEIREKIQNLGGEKAGQVELGWRKQNPVGNYFHFSMPEANYSELVKTLGQYGRVRIYKNPHERVMPEGQIRIILWIEENAIETQDNAKEPE